MKREDVKAKIPGITDEQLNWLMSENGADINREKTVAEQFKKMCIRDSLETTFASLCETLNSIREEAARLCRQPPEYDGGEEDE